MRKLSLLLMPVGLAIIVFSIVMFFVSKTGIAKGALQVTSLPQSDVFLNDKPIGKTPLCKCEGDNMIAVGTYTVKLVPSDTTKETYTEKVVINPSVLTVVDRTFGDIGKSSGSVISLQAMRDTNKSQISVTSIPFGADVTIDSVPVGITPLLKQITDSDHEIVVSKAGYNPKTIRIHGVLGYILNTMVYLGTQDITVANPTPAQNLATSSASLQTPTVLILTTPTGFLRVHDSASLEGAEIAQVHPGEIYPYMNEQNGWFQIKLQDGKLGWVTEQYAKKQ